MARPAKSVQRFTKAKTVKVRAYYGRQNGIPSKKQVDMTRRAFIKGLLRAMDRARKQRLPASAPRRASRSGASGSSRQQGNKNEKNTSRRAVNKVACMLVKGHMSIRRADEAVIEELQKKLKESQDEANRLKEEKEPPYEQDFWEAPMLPDDFTDVVFPQDGTDHMSIGELFMQAPLEMRPSNEYSK